jgi:NAD(P)-dependent dehydrogenase (short-subunit alcohol dehydrogenase family)
VSGGRLEGKVAVITGGASGIGAATVRRFVDEGARVVVADLDEIGGARLAAERPERVAFVRTDVSVEDDVALAIDEATRRWGALHCLFNNAGFGGALGPIATTSEADFDLTFDVLVKGVFFGMKHAAPVMAAQRSGSIISTSSIAALRAGQSPHLYGAAKAAVIQLTRTVAMELGAFGVRVNAICPGAVATPLLAGRPTASDDDIDRMRELSAPMQPLGRIGEPSELAAVALFLACDDSSFVTGQAIVVDGGVDAGVPWRAWPEFMRSARPIRHHRPPGR